MRVAVVLSFILFSFLLVPALAQVASCSGQLDGTPCTDGDPCTYGEACYGEACTGGWAITCGSDTCATRACNGTPTCTVVSVAPDGTPCDDGNSCTSGDTCTAGGCAGMLVDDGLRVDRLAPGSATSVISWNLPASATGSDVVRGLVNCLPVSPTGVCETPLAENQIGATSLKDASVPSPGAAYWYLARGRNACGAGPWGFEEDHGRAALPEVSNGGCVPNAAASPRYVDNGLTVTDRSTCLEWEKKSESPGVNNVDGLYIWSNTGTNPDGTVFKVFLPTLNAGRFARHAGWRLPSEDGCDSSFDGCRCPTPPHEAESILLHSYCYSVGPDPIFGPTSPFNYLSSSTLAGLPHVLWDVAFGPGFVEGVDKGHYAYARAVRGGP